MSQPPPRDHPAGRSSARGTPSRKPAIIGFVAAGALVLALGFLGGLLGGDDASADPLPIRILAPASGDSIVSPLLLRFSTSAPLRLDPRLGWSADGLHLHLMLDDREIMPAAADIAGGDDTFTWTVAGMQPGTRRLFLTWAGADHAPLATRSDTVYVHVR